MEARLECVRLVEGVVCGAAEGEWGSILSTACRAAGELVRAAGECRLPLASAGLAKLLFEAVAQAAYYRLQGVGPGEALGRVSRRSRVAASFSAVMIKRLRGVHGPVKSRILRAYLALGEYTHPSSRLHSGASPGWEALSRALDAVVYLLLAAGFAGSGTVDPGVLKGCGFELAARRASARGR